MGKYEAAWYTCNGSSQGPGEGDSSEKGRKLFEQVMTESFYKLDENLKIQEVQLTWSTRTKETAPSYNITKLLKTRDKEKNLKRFKEKDILYTGGQNKTANFSYPNWSMIQCNPSHNPSKYLF